MLRRLAVAVLLILFAAAIAGTIGALPFLRTVPIGAAYTAKTICSGVFISGRDVADLVENDLLPDLDGYLTEKNITVDTGARTVEARVLFATAKAVYRENCGCTLVIGGVSEAELREQPVGDPFPLPELPKKKLWPAGDRVDLAALPPGLDAAKLQEAFDYAFDEPYEDRKRGTRALVVVYDGRIVAERYAPGFHGDMPLTSWSMTKTVMGTLAGILSGQGKLDIFAPAPVPEWQGAGDPRKAITLDQLLRMSSGLQFQEEYSATPSDVVRMLYEESNTASIPVNMPLEAEPGGKWKYSSGTTNVVSRIVREAIGGDMEHYLRFSRTELFDKLGMRNVVIEADPSGLLVGSSFLYCSPRDWARFGIFLMHDGVWNGERILPEGWVGYMTTPTPLAPRGRYGAHMWLNAGAPGRPAHRIYRSAPADLFELSGYEGQMLFIIPSRNAVIMRMGRTLESENAIDWDELLKLILAGLPENQPG